jgi:hypothetical protein
VKSKSNQRTSKGGWLSKRILNITNSLGKVNDNFFKVIVKKGTLVSLIGGKSGKGRPTLSTLFSKIGFRIFGAVFTNKGKYLSRIRQLNAFHVHLSNMRRHHGSVFVVKYLKVSQLAVQKAIAGTPVKSLRELEPTTLPRVTAKGLPKWIPLRDRQLMLIAGSASVIRWYLTLFAVYRVISIPGVLKLSTITDPITVSQAAIDQVSRAVVKLVPANKFDLSLLGDNPKGAFKVGVSALPEIQFLEKASASGSISWLGLIYDVIWLKRDGILPILLSYLAITGQASLLRLLTHINDNLVPTFGLLPMNSIMGIALQPPTGRLALKEEAAGKVRVFAMVTIWDQIALKSLHNMCFAFLKGLPNDATFNQELSVERCLEKSTLTQQSFGYDLSAATDRLPLSIQSAIINQIKPGLGNIWARLLVGRDYFLPENKGYPLESGKNYRYSVGQPMGALSSWAMLAVTHHLLAQLAAHKAFIKGSPDPFEFWRKGWYSGYEVLGDDIVFFEPSVALEYLAIMSMIGVPINLSKSVVASNSTFEFAKVTGHRGNHVAAISWAMFMAQPTTMGRVGICYSLLRKRINRSGKIIRWITALSRATQYSMGIPNLFFLSLASMFASNKRIKFSEFVHTVVEFQEGKLTLAPILTNPSKLGVIRRALSALTGKNPVQLVEIPAAKSAFLDYSVGDLSLRMGLAKTIKIFVHGPGENSAMHLNPQRDAAKLCKDLILNMLAFTPSGRETLRSLFEKEGVFTLKPKVTTTLSPVGCLVHPVYCFLYAQIYDNLVRKWEQLHSIKPSQLKTKSLVELMSFMDIIEAYREVTSIIERANTKLSKEEIPSKNLIESPLKVLVSVLKSESRLESMRATVLSAGTEFFTKAFAGSETSFYGIFGNPEDSEFEYYPGYKRPAVVPLRGIRAYIMSHGEEFVKEHLPKWGKYAAAMFQEPGEVPEFNP